ncbi:MAG: UDP-N-acetylmuramate dehydrogenase [Bacteroidota bacterium]|nr:UDP-N-acetylmuramate dehydrogenase [Bacteroidota bacterium]
MKIIHNQSLITFNTFKIDAIAKYFVEVQIVDELLELIQKPEFRSNNKLIIGGGSNLLFTKDYDGIVIKINIKGIELISDDSQFSVLKVGAGEVWHEFVQYCINNNLSGIENLSLIPGNVGASPIQNIGAYGVEVKDYIQSLEAVNVLDGTIKSFSNAECAFGYRDSIFKKEEKNKWIITYVVFRLSKKPVLNTSYGAINDELVRQNLEPSIKNISKVVIDIRRSKLPDPNEIGNAGSFFKNPVVSNDKLDELKMNFPNIPNYPQDSNSIKLAAGWLIEQCGWKGKVVGNTGSHKHQALVLVNYGNASGNEIKELAEKIQSSVYEKFGVNIEPEVNMI